MSDFEEVAHRANADILALLQSWLPAGKKDGTEYLVGDKFGAAGDSLRIHVGGNKKGVWKDFATDEGGADLVSLYAAINGLRQGEALKAVAAQVGYTLSGKKPQKPTQKTTQKPEKHDDWQIVMPIPENAPKRPQVHDFRGQYEKYWTYRNNDGAVLGFVYRFKKSDGGKEILPLTLWRHAKTKAMKWIWRGFPTPRPLFLTKHLRDDLPVVVVEGEKCAMALARVISSQYNVVSWPNGSKSAAKVDWSLLAGRKVYLWPDCDAQTDRAGNIKPEEQQPGFKCMVEIAGILQSLNCDPSIIDIPAPGTKPAGWDCADAIDAGASAKDILATIQKVRSVPTRPHTPAPAAALGPVAPEDILSRLFMSGKDNDKVKPCRENILIILEHDERLKGAVALDEFSMLQLKKKPLPWSADLGEWSESDDFNLGLWLAQNYDVTIPNVSDIEKAVAESAKRNSFNSVTDYMDECESKWDGKRRIDTAFADYWGVLDTPYSRIVSKLFFLGIAKRAYFPGCKYDWAPVFEGPQGLGKSTALRILGGEWFGDTPFKMGDKDSYLTIQGTLLYEIAELEQFNRAETTAIKAFMSSTVDRYREPYGRRIKNVQRRTVFAATTNENQYFRDQTGNRRFWPVVATYINTKALQEDRDQLFGEAVARIKSGELWYPTAEEQLLIAPEQASRELTEPWLVLIQRYLEGKAFDGTPLPSGKIDKVYPVDLLTKALHIEAGRMGPAKGEVMRIGTCMRKLGWERKRESSGARNWYYQRPVPQKMEEDDEYIPV